MLKLQLLTLKSMLSVLQNNTNTKDHIQLATGRQQPYNKTHPCRFCEHCSRDVQLYLSL